MKLILRLENIEIEKTIKKTLDTLLQFTTPSGLFKTYRIDYSEIECPNDYINEENAIMIDTKYDHSFILDIILRLRKYFTDTTKFLEIMSKGLKLIIDDAIIKCFNGFQTLQWRYYHIDHQGGEILPDIDDTGRNLIFIERVRELLGSNYVKTLTNKFNIINNPHNYRQFWELIHPVNNSFKPDGYSKDPEFFGLLTHFDNKEGNDVDPVCNITALYSTLLFFNKKFSCITEYDIIYIKRIMDYLFSFLNSDVCIDKTHEYYEPIVVFYNYSKLIELCENLQKPLRNFILIENAHKSRLLYLLLRELEQNKLRNSLEKAFGVTSLLILGYRGDEIQSKIIDIIKDRKNGYWNAFRFYRQRHPHRIFGSKALTTAVCLEALSYWRFCRS